MFERGFQWSGNGAFMRHPSNNAIFCLLETVECQKHQYI